MFTNELEALQISCRVVSFRSILKEFHKLQREYFQAESLATCKLADVAITSGDIVVQRLGYILECVLADRELSTALYNYLEPITHYSGLLRPQRKKPGNIITNNKWKIVPNVEIEAEI